MLHQVKNSILVALLLGFADSGLRLGLGQQGIVHLPGFVDLHLIAEGKRADGGKRPLDGRSRIGGRRVGRIPQEIQRRLGGCRGPAFDAIGVDDIGFGVAEIDHRGVRDRAAAGLCFTSRCRDALQWDAGHEVEGGGRRSAAVSIKIDVRIHLCSDGVHGLEQVGPRGRALLVELSGLGLAAQNVVGHPQIFGNHRIAGVQSQGGLKVAGSACPVVLVDAGHAEVVLLGGLLVALPLQLCRRGSGGSVSRSGGLGISRRLRHRASVGARNGFLFSLPVFEFSHPALGGPLDVSMQAGLQRGAQLQQGSCSIALFGQPIMHRTVPRIERQGLAVEFFRLSPASGAGVSIGLVEDLIGRGQSGGSARCALRTAACIGVGRAGAAVMNAFPLDLLRGCRCCGQHKHRSGKDPMPAHGGPSFAPRRKPSAPAGNRAG